MPYKGDKGDKNAARPPEGSLVETRCLIKGPKSAIVPFPGPRSGPKSRTGPGALAMLNMLQAQNWVTTHFIFCLPAGAIEPVSVVLVQATLSLSKKLWGPVFPFTILVAVFTASSAWPLDWGYATEDNLCLTHHVLRNSSNLLEAKGELPSVLSSSEAQYVWNSCRQMDINLVTVA